MPRPSRNQDRALLAAGRALLPVTGCAGLTIRQVAQAARVNSGMFHYHFKTREAFLRAVMQATYEEMFARLTFEVAHPREASAGEHLRSAFRVLGRFLRDNRAFIARILADAMAGEAVARDFLRDNLPRHLAVLTQLIAAGQASGELRRMPTAQALGFCGGALAMPILVGGAISESGALPKAPARALAATLLANDAIDQRIDLALAALAGSGRAPRIKKTRKLEVSKPRGPA